MSNQLMQKPSFSVAINTKVFQASINNTLRDAERARRFTASIVSAVSTNPALQECDAGTIVTAALLGESLNLSPSPQLGQYYLVPFKSKAKYDKSGKMIEPARTVAQFQLGYKGYIQLAIRSGYYKKLNVMAIKEGELISFNPLEEEIEVQLIEDEEARENAQTIGYYAMFEYQNGFRKALYWTKAKMEKHAQDYSKGYAARKGYTFWEKDFDSMAYKTMLRQLISKWGIMSIEMQDVFTKDMAVLEKDDNGDTNVSYIDTKENTIAQGEPEDITDIKSDMSEESEPVQEELSLDDI